MGFAESIRINSSKVLEETQAKCYLIMDELFNNVIGRTPVLKGDLINNWFANPSETPSYETTTTLDLSGYNSKLSVENLYQANLFNGKDDVASLTNNLPYAANAEYLGWPEPNWSGKVGPYSMVRDSLLVVATKYKGE